MMCMFGRGRDHVKVNNLPALINKFYEAKINKKDMVIWGNGSAKRDFMHTEDLADATIFSMNLDHQKFFSESSKHFSHINIGTGFEISIKELVSIISKIFKFETLHPASGTA